MNFESSEIPKIVIVGHVDHGKSSFIGRFLYDIEEITEEKVLELKKASESRGVEFEFAFLLDALQDERDQGITIDTTRIFFKTKTRKYVFIDSPGHKEFIRNMITGAASADIAVLIVDVNEGVKQQTRKHAYLLKLLGIETVITIYNKMDLIKYNEDKFKKIKVKLDNYLTEINVQSYASIPVSSKLGDNISTKSKKMEWYIGKTFIEVLDSYDISKNSDSEFLRFPVQDIYKIKDKRVIVGKIELENYQKGKDLIFLPSNERVKIKLLRHGQVQKKSIKGEIL